MYSVQDVSVIINAIEKLYSDRFEIYFDIVKREQLKLEAVFDHFALKLKRIRRRTGYGHGEDYFVCIPRKKLPKSEILKEAMRSR